MVLLESQPPTRYMDRKLKILIPDRVSEPYIEREIFPDSTEIHTAQASNPSDIDLDVWHSSDAILGWHDIKYSENLLRELDNCILVRVGVGVDNVDIECASQLGIPVCNVPDYGTNDVADHTMALLLTLWRGLPYYNKRIQVSNDGWKWESNLSMLRLTDSQLTIIGLGRIGTAVARRAKAFGINVVGYDPYVPDGYEKSLGINRTHELDEALEEADAVTFHTPLTEETNQMADEEFFSQLNENAILINTARGRIIDLDALYSTLKNGKLRAAGLDVLEVEPPDRSHPLIQAYEENQAWIDGRFILTPHSAFYCEEAIAEMRRKAAETALDYLKDGILRNCINKDMINNEG